MKKQTFRPAFHFRDLRGSTLRYPAFAENAMRLRFPGFAVARFSPLRESNKKPTHEESVFRFEIYGARTRGLHRDRVA